MGVAFLMGSQSTFPSRNHMCFAHGSASPDQSQFLYRYQVEALSFRQVHLLLTASLFLPLLNPAALSISALSAYDTVRFATLN